MTHARLFKGSRLRSGAWLSVALFCALVAGGCVGSGRSSTPAAPSPASATAAASEAPAPTSGPGSGTEAPGVVPQAGAQTGAALFLSSLRMASTGEGWATGWTASGPRIGGILHTGDGGYEWLNVSPPGIDPASIETTEFLDARHAWVVSSTQPGATARPVATRLTILRTDDGGQTWQGSAPLTLSSSGPGWLSFVDAQHGWFLANLGQVAGSMAVELYHTTDGGAHWDSISVTAGNPSQSTRGSLPLECNKTGISFVSTTTGWATGHCTTGGVFFWLTRDGGLSWQSQVLQRAADMPAGIFDNCDCETVPPVFASAQNGVAPVKIFTTQHEAVLYVTQDGGSTWFATPLASNALLRPPDFVDANNGWITDETRIFLTRDGGRTWSPVARLPDLRLLGTLDFVDLRNGWATGGAQVYRTTDGGQTWSPFTPVLAPGVAATTPAP